MRALRGAPGHRIEWKESGAPAVEEALVLKGLGTMEIKDADEGRVEAVIATLGVVDRDSDVITTDAIKSGAKVKMSGYGHDAMWGGTPVGKGAIFVDGNKAVFKGQLFLSTARGKEIFSVLKEMGTDQEWSFGFRVMGSEVPDEDWTKKGARRILTKLDAFEVSPVMIGAGVGTRTLAVKEADDAAQQAAAVEAAERTAREAAEAAAAEAKRATEETERKTLAETAVREELARFERTRRRFG